MSKIYEIPIIQTSCKVYKIEANNLQEAIKEAEKEFFNEPDEHYIEDSYEIDNHVYDKNENEQLI